MKKMTEKNIYKFDKFQLILRTQLEDGTILGILRHNISNILVKPIIFTDRADLCKVMGELKDDSYDLRHFHNSEIERINDCEFSKKLGEIRAKDQKAMYDKSEMYGEKDGNILPVEALTYTTDYISPDDCMKEIARKGMITDWIGAHSEEIFRQSEAVRNKTISPDLNATLLRLRKFLYGEIELGRPDQCQMYVNRFFKAEQLRVRDEKKYKIPNPILKRGK